MNVSVFVEDGDVLKALKVLKRKLDREGIRAAMGQQQYMLRLGERLRQKGRKAIKRYRKSKARQQ